MPAYSTPVGFQPVKLLGDRPYTNAQSEFPIATGYATALRPGDLVRLNAAGFLAKETGTATPLLNGGGILGVFLGCSYTDAVLGKTYRTNWTASTAAADAVGYVCSDPDAIFRAVYVSGTTVVTGLTVANALGKNVAMVQNTTSTGTSDVAISGVAATATLPFRIVGVDPDSLNAAGTLYTAMFVTYNAGMHSYRVAASATV